MGVSFADAAKEVEVGRLINYMNANPQIAATFPEMDNVRDALRDLYHDRNRWRARYQSLHQSVQRAMEEGAF